MERFISLLVVVCLPSVLLAATYETTFTQQDANKDDALSKEEFAAFWLSSLDGNADGHITSGEFQSRWGSHLSASTAAHSLVFFIEMDLNHDLRITRDEIDAFFRFFDYNKDDYVTYGEFTNNWDSFFKHPVTSHHHVSTSHGD